MATLKISDLSVGDWVQDNYGSYVKVEGIWQGCDFNVGMVKMSVPPPKKNC